MGSDAPPRAVVAGRLVAAVAFATALLLGAEVLPDRVAMVVSDLVFPAVALSAGALLVLTGLQRPGRDRTSWILLGIGVTLFGAGEALWAWYELVLGVEPPFPGIPDVAYLAAYPLLALGLLTAPRLAANGYERAQQAVDGVVVTVAAAIVVWAAILEPIYEASAGGTALELAVAAGYPVGDLVVIATIGAVGFRRSAVTRNWPLWLVVAGLMATASGDIVYLTQTWTSEYVSGSWVDATWLVGYGLFALSVTFLTDRPEPQLPRERRLPVWHVLLPVGIILGIVAVHIGRQATSGSNSNLVFEITLSGLGAAVLVRILLSVAEDRYLVDVERKQLISVVSHELRTPLTAVHGYLDLLTAEWSQFDEASRHQMVTTAGEQARLVTRIVTDLVAASRDQLHAVDLAVEAVDVSSVADEAVAALGIAATTTVVTEPGSVVVADRERLNQILTNLLSNAERYGRGAIVCLARPVNGSVEVAVHDDGPGVPARYRDTIWNRFERGAHRFDATTPGSGLGLAIVRSLALAHGGQVGYRPSALLGGACFWVKLPRAPAGPDPELRIPAPQPALAG